MSRRVGVSDLADYASDPEDFCRRRGGVRNARAAAHGQRVHDGAMLSWARLAIGLLLIALIVAVFVSPGWVLGIAAAVFQWVAGWVGALVSTALTG